MERVSVRIDTPPGARLSEFFGELRTWLDNHHIEIVEFTAVTGPTVGYAISFCSKDEAKLFEQRFA
jgi:hypothetical protein